MAEIIKIHRLSLSEWCFMIATLCITPLRIFTYIDTLSTTFRLTITFIAIICYVVGCITVEPKKRNKYFLLLLITFIFCTLNWYGQWKDLITYFEKMYAYLLFFIPFLLGIYYIECDKEWMKRRLLAYILILECITLVTTILGLQIYPEASRALASSAASSEFKEMNIGGYEFIYGLVVVFPLLLYSLHKKKRIYKIIAMVAIVYCVFISQYTIAISLVCANLLLYQIAKIRNIRIKILLCILLALLTIFAVVMSDYIFEQLGNLFSSANLDSIAEKFYDLSTSSLSGISIGTVEVRNYQYSLSLSSIISAPLFGRLLNSSLTCGGHSELLDVWASCGLLVLIGVAYLINSYRATFITTFGRGDAKKSFTYILLTFIAVAAFDTILNSPVVAINAFLVPALYYKRSTDMEGG